MPIVRVEMLEGRSVEQKREIAAVFTRELARIAGCTEAGVTVVIDEYPKHNWAVGGTLMADKIQDKK
jgi:4-oxalocrotonate tautomerase